MITSEWKQRLYKEPLFGCFVTFASPAIAEFTAMIGFDFTLIDNEHGNMNDETVEDMARASQCADVPAIVRVPYNRTEYMRRSLDFGANGVQVPLVDNADLAKQVVAATHYPPKGDRGVAFLPRASRYGMCQDKAKYLADADANKLVAVHIETVTAVKNLESIMDIDGIDVFFVGPADLGVSMGYASNLGHADVVKKVDATLEAIAKRGKIAGTYVGDAARAKQAVSCGATYVVTALSAHMIKGGTEFLRDARG